MARNLMGFKKVDGIPCSVARGIKGQSIYDPLLKEVREEGGTYALDTKDRKRAANLAVQLRKVAAKNGFEDIAVTVRWTAVYVHLKD